MVVFIVVPKNSGLKRYREIAIQSLGVASNETLEVRGEDVPFWVESLAKTNKRVVGITGQDLFREYQIREYETKLQVLKVIEWDDEAAIFKKPVLCLLGPQNKSLETIPRQQRVCISAKYKFLGKRYLNFLETKGYRFDKFYVNGSSEESFSVGLSDLVIDIVYTGSSMKKLGLSVYDKIFVSNIVVIGGNENGRS